MTPLTHQAMQDKLAALNWDLTRQPLRDETLLKDLRRGRPIARPSMHIALVADKEGMLRWEWGPDSRIPATPLAQTSRRRATASRIQSVIYSNDIPRLGSNQILTWLRDFDKSCNLQLAHAEATLRQLQTTNIWATPTPPPPGPGNILLFVHGTASSCDHICGVELDATTPGQRLLSKARDHYQAVLAFDHPTISVSPFINALDLDRLLAPYADKNIDIICHSRGGLVSSWWMHVIDKSPRLKRCVFVGSPLGGTNLANPARLRESLHLLAEYGRLLGDVAGTVGLFTLPAAILTVIASVVDFSSRTPVLDAAFAMIPGLGAQSRTDNNSELSRLKRLHAQAAPNHFYIRANFNSEDPGWKFWRYITDEPKLRAANLLTDRLVFQSRNDLIVDFDSMSLDEDSTTIPPSNILDFDQYDSRVHHTNYFRQPKTIEHIHRVLGIPA